MSKRVYGNVQSMEGEQVGTLQVEQLRSRTPLRYSVRCDQCGTASIATHEALRRGTARCPASICGTDATRAVLSDTPNRFRERLSAAERKRQSEKTAAQEIAKREAEAELLNTSRKVAALVKERLLKTKDDEVFVTPGMEQSSMSSADAARYNGQQFKLFMQSTPEYVAYSSPETIESLGDCFARNKLMICSQEMCRAAFFRLRDCGLLTPNRAVEPRPVEKTVQRPVTVVPAPQTQAEVLPDGSELGYDLFTGEQRPYTKREIAALSADQYRRVFRVYRDALTLPNRIW